MVTLAWLLDFKKAIRRNDHASRLSDLADSYLIELSVFIGISYGSNSHHQIVLGTNKL